MSETQQITEAAPLEAPASRWNRAHLQINLWRVALGIGLLVAWQLASDYTGKMFISGPLDVLIRIDELIGTGELWHHSLVTFEETAYGYSIGAVAAIALPFLLRLSPRLMTALDPYMAAMMAVPKLALAPLIILWFGIGIMSKVLFVASLVFFLIFFNVLAGVLAAEAHLVQMARVAGASEWLIAREVVAIMYLTNANRSLSLV